MKDFSYITNSHPAYIESLYNDYLNNSDSVDAELKKFFEGFDYALSTNPEVATKSNATASSAPIGDVNLQKELAVYNLILAYRQKGHLIADTNPIRPRKDRKAYLDLKDFGLSEADLKSKFAVGAEVKLPNGTLEEILAKLKRIYASKIGFQFTYMNQKDAYEWSKQTFEELMNKEFSLDEKKRILHKLNFGVIFEKFLGTKFIGQKRFGLEGGEAMIPALDRIITGAADHEVEEVIIGMAHRGRLNVLTNILRKTYDQIFSEFEGAMPTDFTMGSGDVKYHMGFRSQVKTAHEKDITIQLLPNPSHLETVDPIVGGFARAKADILYNNNYSKVLPILLHGDAAVAGQGIVYECLQMSKLEGYNIGGTIHFVINNQIGFTTDFEDARSADYCTSVAAMVQAPVLHVNGDDAEAVVRAAIFAIEYRQKFKQDVFIDMVCYRKNGHNEGDEPKFTQPQLYALIDKHPNPREQYTQYLIQNGTADAQAMAKEMEAVYWEELQARLDETKQNQLPYKYQEPEQAWADLKRAKNQDFEQSPVTAVEKDRLEDTFNQIMQWPADFKPNRKIEKLLKDKVKVFAEQGKIDWATGELLAYATILQDGGDVRLSGEDVKRGTFSHRHATLRDENTGAEYNRINALNNKNGKFYVYNSLLSEYAVLGFDYGYAMASPNNLVIWEAQYGDFSNGAQIIIDQYVSGAEEKWTTQNGLVMLLPHGYEGGGPEHSSARLERFLQMSAENNMIITNITTAANFFHALRRQLAWNFRKPMVNFSPKANLRHLRSYSTIEEFTTGGFQEVIDDSFIQDPNKVKRVLLCTGKMYFDLSDKQLAENRDDVAIIRLEQIHPLPQNQLKKLTEKYRNAQWLWVQEEPRNMGAASFLKMNLEGINIGYLTRQAAAATATGFAKKHISEQKALVDEAFSI